MAIVYIVGMQSKCKYLANKTDFVYILHVRAEQKLLIFWTIAYPTMKFR